jgi:hypothetical protein
LRLRFGSGLFLVLATLWLRLPLWLWLRLRLWMHCLFWLIVPLSQVATFVPPHTFRLRWRLCLDSHVWLGSGRVSSVFLTCARWPSFLSATFVVSHLAYSLAFVSIWRNDLCLVLVASLVIRLRPSSLARPLFSFFPRFSLDLAVLLR